MKVIMQTLFVAFVLLVSAQVIQAQGNNIFSKSFTVEVKNALNTFRNDVLIVIKEEHLAKIKSFNKKAFSVWYGNNEIPSQYNDKDLTSRGIVFVIDQLKANEKRLITVRYNPKGEVKHQYVKRTQAELSHKINGEWKNREYVGGTFKNVDYLRVPAEHKDHSWFIRYEGPGWESDKVGYRFYLDQRNATDVFGKKVPEPSLQLAGQDGFDSYHNMQPWGMDVMKVGKSLGVGSIGALSHGKVTRVELTDSVTCSITENGVIYSSILTQYYGWNIGGKKYNLQSVLSIHAGTRLTQQQLTISNGADTLCTGLVKDKNAKLFTNAGDATTWGYLATYGKQSLNNDNLGLVVFFNPAQALGFSEDVNSHIVLLKPLAGKVDYYFAGVWELEPNGITTEEKFLTYIKSVAQQLAKSITVNIK